MWRFVHVAICYRYLYASFRCCKSLFQRPGNRSIWKRHRIPDLSPNMYIPHPTLSFSANAYTVQAREPTSGEFSLFNLIMLYPADMSRYLGVTYTLFNELVEAASRNREFALFVEQSEAAQILTLAGVIMMFLFRCKWNLSFSMTALLFRVSPSTCLKLFNAVAEAIPRFWGAEPMPVTTDRVNELIGSFDGELTNVVGIIDATEHPRERWMKEEESMHSGKTRQSTMMSQVIVDGKGRLVSIQTGFPGHMNDINVWKESAAFKWMQDLRQMNHNLRLLGDKGYRGQEEILVPFSKKQTKENEELSIFNAILYKWRSVVENLNARLKNFRICRDLFIGSPKSQLRVLQAICLIVARLIVPSPLRSNDPELMNKKIQRRQRNKQIKEASKQRKYHRNLNQLIHRTSKDMERNSVVGLVMKYLGRVRFSTFYDAGWTAWLDRRSKKWVTDEIVNNFLRMFIPDDQYIDSLFTTTIQSVSKWPEAKSKSRLLRFLETVTGHRKEIIDSIRSVIRRQTASVIIFPFHWNREWLLLAADSTKHTLEVYNSAKSTKEVEKAIELFCWLWTAVNGGEWRVEYKLGKVKEKDGCNAGIWTCLFGLIRYNNESFDKIRRVRGEFAGDFRGMMGRVMKLVSLLGIEKANRQTLNYEIRSGVLNWKNILWLFDVTPPEGFTYNEP